MSATDDYIVTIVGSTLAASLFLFPLIEETEIVIKHNSSQVEKVLVNLYGRQEQISNQKLKTMTLHSAFGEAKVYGLNGVQQGEEARAQFLVEFESMQPEKDD